jgi:hypothetical protein
LRTALRASLCADLSITGGARQNHDAETRDNQAWREMTI